jgi:hypothetical protein
VQYKARSAQPRSHRTAENVENVVLSNRRVSIRVMAVQLNSDKETARKNLSYDMCMKNVSAKMVPHKTPSVKAVSDPKNRLLK